VVESTNAPQLSIEQRLDAVRKAERLPAALDVLGLSRE
jgi:hypothetical protein